MSSLTAKIFTLSSAENLMYKEETLNFDNLDQNEIIAETFYSAISPGTESAAWSGLPPLRPGSIYPRFMGYCNVAKIVAIGDKVTGIEKGDFILTFQSHCSHFKCNTNDFFIKLPENNFTSFTPAYLYHLGYNALLSANARAGHNVGIIGAGVLGYSSAIMSDICGGATFVFSNQMEAAKKLASKKINCSPKTAEAIDAINISTNNTGLDIVINTSNSWQDWLFALQAVNKGGTIVNLGFPGRGEDPPLFNPLDPQYVYTKHLTIKALCAVSETDIPAHEMRFTMKRNMEYIIGLIHSGKIDTTEIITDEINYASLGEQYKKYAERKNYMLSTLIHWKN